MFDWRWVSFQSFQGWMVVASFLASALAAAAALRFVVQRAKKCLDFGVTVYVLHLLAVCANSGFPTHIVWCVACSLCCIPASRAARAVPGRPHLAALPRPRRWLSNGVNLTCTALLGEWLCVQQEMKEIPLASIPRQRGATELASASTPGRK
jgi:hypothetical protein